MKHLTIPHQKRGTVFNLILQTKDKHISQASKQLMPQTKIVSALANSILTFSDKRTLETKTSIWRGTMQDLIYPENL